MRITIDTHGASSNGQASATTDYEPEASLPADDATDTGAHDMGRPPDDLVAEMDDETDLEVGAPPDWLAEAIGDQEGVVLSGDGSSADSPYANGVVDLDDGTSEGHVAEDTGGPPEF